MSEILKGAYKGYQDPVLWYQFLHNTLTPIVFFFRLNALKGTTTAPIVVLLSFNTLSCTKTVLLSSKMYDAHPCPFFWDVMQCLGRAWRDIPKKRPRRRLHVSPSFFIGVPPGFFPVSYREFSMWAGLDFKFQQTVYAEHLSIRKINHI